MKNKKILKKRFAIFILMIGFCFCLVVNFSGNYLGFGGVKTHKKSELNPQELQTLDKIKKDLDVFKSKGALKISEDNIFYPIHKSGISERMLEVCLEDTALRGNAHSFIKVEKKYGVNAIYLLAIANHESNFGESRIAKDKKNLFGFNAIDSNPYNGASEYESLDKGIQEIGKKIKILYLSENGKYFKGYNSYAMNKNYASDKNWGEKVNNHMIMIAEKILNSYK